MQATELAEFTAKISLLEEAKKKKDEEATEWQHKVGGAAEILPGAPEAAIAAQCRATTSCM